MKKMFQSQQMLLLGLAVMGLLSSCVSVKRSGYTQDVSRTDIIQSPLMADLEVDTKGRVSAEFTAKGSEHNAKQGALYEAMQRNGCDVLVHPFYEVKFYPMSIIKANVTGYCGKYKAIRKPNLEDISIMQELHSALNPDRPLTMLLTPVVPNMAQSTPQAGPVINRNSEDWLAYKRMRNRGIGWLATGIIFTPMGTSMMAMYWATFADTEDETDAVVASVFTAVTIFGIASIGIGANKFKQARAMKPSVDGKQLSLFTRPVRGHQTIGLAMKF